MPRAKKTEVEPQPEPTLKVRIDQRVAGYREVGKVIEVEASDWINTLITKGYLTPVDASTPVNPLRTRSWSTG